MITSIMRHFPLRGLVGHSGEVGLLWEAILAGVDTTWEGRRRRGGRCDDG